MEEINPATLVILSALIGGFLTSCITHANFRSFVGKLILKFILGWRYWLLYPLIFVYFFYITKEMGKGIEEALPSANGMLIVAIFYASMGLLISSIASNKGRENLGGWFIYGTFLFVIALPHIILVESRPQTEKDNREIRR